MKAKGFERKMEEVGVWERRERGREGRAWGWVCECEGAKRVSPLSYSTNFNPVFESLSLKDLNPNQVANVDKTDHCNELKDVKLNPGPCGWVDVGLISPQVATATFCSSLNFLFFYQVVCFIVPPVGRESFGSKTLIRTKLPTVSHSSPLPRNLTQMWQKKNYCENQVPQKWRFFLKLDTFLRRRHPRCRSRPRRQRRRRSMLQIQDFLC